ncbi:phage antirepressor KilAC domain-containing protein [Aeromonas caviae]|uniref:phage antirepressor KilAC domain-containing protein n=1 Tax=Aeromonas caviae TaxID=648 RepID=UPI002B4A3350|nr:phage antirepressor KilAC domain-containing protein [Aeromonas caviae]
MNIQHPNQFLKVGSLGANTLPVIAGVEIATDEMGRFNLNALHKAHLSMHPDLHKNSKQPADWLKLEQTKELIEALFNSEDFHSWSFSREDQHFGLVVTKMGRYGGGTFAQELLAISYAGWISPAFQLQVNQVFLDYRTGKLKPALDPMTVLNDPASMRGLLLTYSEKVLALEERVGEMAPVVQAFDRIATAEGSLNLTEAAKVLQVPPRKLTAHLQAARWIYKRPGARHWLGYQDKVQQGLLEHKLNTFQKGDGSEGVSEQVRILPKGITKLAQSLSIGGVQ